VGDLVIIAAVFFLAGFKIAAWLGKRHLRRMETIWKGKNNA
jgi:hypothetical protein